MIDRFNIQIQHIPKAIMFQTIAVSVSIVCVLLCGVGYVLYKKGIQMLKDIDKKYEEGKLNLQVKVSEFEDKVKELKISHQEMIESLKTRINVLENIVEHNLEHTENLMIDLNNKNMVTRNMLYDVKKHFSIATREHTTQFTDTKNEIDIIKTSFNDMKKVIVTQQELEDALFICGKVNPTDKLGTTHSPSYDHMLNAYHKCIECKRNSSSGIICITCSEHLKTILENTNVQLQNRCIKNLPFYQNVGYHYVVNTIRINKKYYLYDHTRFTLFNLTGKKAIEFFEENMGMKCLTGIYLNKPTPLFIGGPNHTPGNVMGISDPSQLVWYEIGTMNPLTKEVSWH